LALAELLKAGYADAAAALDSRQPKIVNREVRKEGLMLGLDKIALAELMRHHRA